MHMWLWYGYNLGPFMFDGIDIESKLGLAGVCIVLFIVGFLFEGSKVYVAQTQRNAARKLFPHRRNDERRNLLSQPGSSQSEGRVQVASLSRRLLLNAYQTSLYLTHNVVSYLLMLAVMLYNLWLIIAIVLGMIAGYFVFGPRLTKLQTECFAIKGPNCTDKCDDNAEGTTPPLLHASLNSDFFACETPSCSRRDQPEHSTSAQVHSEPSTSCYYGAKVCPSKVAVAEKLKKSTPNPFQHEDRKNSSVEDTMLLPEETCYTNTTPPLILTAKDSSQSDCCHSQEKGNDIKREENEIEELSSRDNTSPKVSCCQSQS